MNRDRRDYIILRKIVKYCDGIASSIKRFGDSEATLESDMDYLDSVSMKILQIGELTTRLSDDFKSYHNEIPWRNIKNMRNIVAHNYESFDSKYVWKTASENVPALREFCHRILEQNSNVQ